MYVAHKWLGIAALALMLGHDAIEPELEGLVRETTLGEFASDLGEVAFDGFIVLILLSWIKRIPFTRLELPWQVWRFTHRFTGLLFAMAAFHQLAIDEPTGIDGTLGWYLNTLSIAGLSAWVFSQFVMPFLRPRDYSVSAVERHGAVTELKLVPRDRPLRWTPGQFVFVGIPDAGLAEPHPFTIASAPVADGSLRLDIKRLGDWTGRLSQRVLCGTAVRVEGPYGRFAFRRRVRRQIWLAGGIGITPFLAWADSLTDADRQEIVLVWSVAKRVDAFAEQRLNELAAQHPGLSVHIIAGDEGGRLTAERLLRLLPFEPAQAELFHCGPRSLRDAIVSGLEALSQGPRRVHAEAYEMR